MAGLATTKSYVFAILATSIVYVALESIAGDLGTRVTGLHSGFGIADRTGIAPTRPHCIASLAATPAHAR